MRNSIMRTAIFTLFLFAACALLAQDATAVVTTEKTAAVDVSGIRNGVPYTPSATETEGTDALYRTMPGGTETSDRPVPAEPHPYPDPDRTTELDRSHEALPNILDVPVKDRDRLLAYARIQAMRADYASAALWLASRGMDAVALYAEMPSTWTPGANELATETRNLKIRQAERSTTPPGAAPEIPSVILPTSITPPDRTKPDNSGSPIEQPVNSEETGKIK